MGNTGHKTLDKEGSVNVSSRLSSVFFSCDFYFVLTNFILANEVIYFGVETTTKTGNYSFNHCCLPAHLEGSENYILYLITVLCYCL